MAQLDYTVPALGSTGWGTALNDILTEIKTNFNELEGTTSSFVTKDTEQTISATKTFTTSQIIKNGGTYSTTPATYAYVEAQDSANKKTASWGSLTDPSGRTITSMRAYNPDDNTKVANISAIVTSAGVAQTYATSPSSATANDNQIATTAWVRNHCCTTKATTASTASKDAPAYVIKNYKNGTNWYRVWSDGWIEQGGNDIGTSFATIRTINFHKAFANAGATVILGSSGANNTGGYSAGISSGITTTGFSYTGLSLANNSANSTCWYACGY